MINWFVFFPLGGVVGMFAGNTKCTNIFSLFPKCQCKSNLLFKTPCQGLWNETIILKQTVASLCFQRKYTVFIWISLWTTIWMYSTWLIDWFIDWLNDWLTGRIGFNGPFTHIYTVIRLRLKSGFGTYHPTP